MPLIIKAALTFAVAAALWIVTTLFGGILSDRIGRRPTYLLGFGFQLVWAIPMFLMIGIGNMFIIVFAVLVFTIPIGLSYGPQSAMYSEMLPSRTVYPAFPFPMHSARSSVEPSRPPSLNTSLVQRAGSDRSTSTWPLAIVSGGAVLTIKKPRGTPLTPEQEASQVTPASVSTLETQEAGAL